MKRPMWQRYLIMVTATVASMAAYSAFAGWHIDRLWNLLWLLLIESVFFGIFYLLMRRASEPPIPAVPRQPTGTDPAPSDPQ